MGANQNKKTLLGTLFYSLKHNKKKKININSQVRDFLYVNDLCKFLELLIKKRNINHKGNLLNVTAENWINLDYLFDFFSKKIKKNFKKLIVISSSKKHLDYYSSGDLFKKKFKKFKFTDFKVALKKTFSVFWH